MPEWLTSEDVAFEQPLSILLQRYGSVAIFHGRPVVYSLLHSSLREASISADLFDQLNWKRYSTIHQVRAAIESGVELVESIQDRFMGYAGWLLTNSQFLAERKLLHSRWNAAVEHAGAMPAYCVQETEPKSPKSTSPFLSGPDVVDLRDGIAEFRAFFDRWQLRSLVTWDLPEPCMEVNLTGHALTSRCRTAGHIVFDVPAILRLPAHSPLQQCIEQIQREQTPEHLRGWLDVQNRQDDDGMGHARFSNIFRLAFYRDTVLASRYKDRFAGYINELDEAFAAFFNLGTDSVKRLRLKMTKLRAMQD